MKYWYNIGTGQEEEDSETARKDDLLSPYATREEAQNALQHARENTERWDEEDRREREWEGKD